MATNEDSDVRAAPADRAPGRREIIARTRAQKRRNRPFIVAGLLIFLAVLTIPAVAYVQKFVLPPRELAVRVGDVVYTRGDVVDFIRFHQRLAEEQNASFNITDDLLGALETISENEIAYQSAPSLGVTVEEAEVDAAVRDRLGFPGLTAEEARDPATRADIREALRQLLNRIQMSESTYRDILRKQLFREKARQVLAADVPRIQPQVHVYVIDIAQGNDVKVERARRRLAAGEPIQDVARDLSDDPGASRTGGELGWFPEGVDLDRDKLYFGIKESGDRFLPLQTLSEPVWDGQARLFHLYYIAEASDTREVDQESYDALTERALKFWVADQQKQLGHFTMVLNDRIFNWIGKQVRLSAIRPTPTPEPPPFGIPGIGG